MPRARALSLLAALVAASPVLAQPLTTAFTYQGELADNGAPVNGTYDLRFALYDTAGSQLGATLCIDNLAVVNGRFSVQLDFGPQFSGQQRFLEVLVRPDTGAGCADGSNFTTLLPRTELTAAPNAAFALAAGTAASASTAANATLLNNQPASFYSNAGNLSGTLPSAVLSGPYSAALTLSNPANQFTGAFSGSGANITSLHAGNVSTGILDNARTTGTPLPIANTLVLRDQALGFSAGAINATSFTGNGANLIALNASNISTGTIANARTTGTATATGSTLVLRDPSGGFSAGAVTAASFTGAHSGDGSALTALNAANIASGTLSNSRTTGTAAGTPATLVLRDASGGFAAGAITAASFAGAHSGDGSALTNLSAGSFTSGLLPPALGGTGANTTSASIGQVLKWNGSAWTPGVDLDSTTSYTAGQGLSLSGTVFSIPTGGVTSTLLASDAASLAKVSANALTVSSGDIIATGTSTADDFLYTAPAAVSYMVAPPAFTPRDGTAFNISLDQNAIFPMSNSASGIAAPVNLPHGCTITAVRFYTVDNSGTANLTFSLLESQPTGSTQTLLAQAATSGSSAAVQTLTVSGLSHTVNTGTSTYLITVVPSSTWNSSTMTVKGVRIDYTLPRPAR